MISIIKEKTQMNKKIKDITNEKYNMLIVLSYAYTKNHKTYWNCKCDCGNECVIAKGNLMCGITKSCGCRRIKSAYLRRKQNEYSLSGDFGIGYTNKGELFYFDKEDYDKIKNYYWQSYSNGYLFCLNIENGKKTNILIHRLIMDCPKDMVVDHINHNTFDNRKCNLRVCTVQQNAMNKIINKVSSSGHTGVYWDGSKNKWRAAIQYKGKFIFLGRYDDINDAINARLKAEEKYFGEFRNLEEVDRQ